MNNEKTSSRERSFQLISHRVVTIKSEIPLLFDPETESMDFPWDEFPDLDLRGTTDFGGNFVRRIAMQVPGVLNLQVRPYWMTILLDEASSQIHTTVQVDEILKGLCNDAWIEPTIEHTRFVDLATREVIADASRDSHIRHLTSEIEKLRVAYLTAESHVRDFSSIMRYREEESQLHLEQLRTAVMQAESRRDRLLKGLRSMLDGFLPFIRKTRVKQIIVATNDHIPNLPNTTQ